MDLQTHVYFSFLLILVNMAQYFPLCFVLYYACCYLWMKVFLSFVLMCLVGNTLGKVGKVEVTSTA
jgi:hypothetical protein